MFSKAGQMTYFCKRLLRVLLKTFLFTTYYFTPNSDHLRHYPSSVTLTSEFNCITSVYWSHEKHKYPRLYRKKKEENDSKDHFVEFISKYLSNFACISLCSIEAKQNYTCFRFRYLL